MNMRRFTGETPLSIFADSEGYPKAATNNGQSLVYLGFVFGPYYHMQQKTEIVTNVRVL